MVILTVSRVSAEQCHRELLLSHVPDTQRPVLSPGRHDVWLGGMVVQAVDWYTLSRPETQNNTGLIPEGSTQQAL